MKNKKILLCPECGFDEFKEFELKVKCESCGAVFNSMIEIEKRQGETEKLNTKLTEEESEKFAEVCRQRKN